MDFMQLAKGTFLFVSGTSHRMGATVSWASIVERACRGWGLKNERELEQWAVLVDVGNELPAHGTDEDTSESESTLACAALLQCQADGPGKRGGCQLLSWLCGRVKGSQHSQSCRLGRPLQIERRGLCECLLFGEDAGDGAGGRGRRFAKL